MTHPNSTGRKGGGWERKKSFYWSLRFLSKAVGDFGQVNTAPIFRGAFNLRHAAFWMPAAERGRLTAQCQSELLGCASGVTVRPSRKHSISGKRWPAVLHPHPSARTPNGRAAEIVLLRMECATSALAAFATEGEESLPRKGVNEILSAVLLWVISGFLIVWREAQLGIVQRGCKKHC